jgi:hypothetical protein
MEPTAAIISKLVDGRFAISTRPGDALSEIELREELAKMNSRADIVDGIVYRVKEIECVAVQTLRIAKLPSGLELWISENGAYTVPARTSLSEIEQTLTTVTEWARKNHPANSAAVSSWLEAYEDQYSYLSLAMPQRQSREISKEHAKEMLARFFPKTSS